MLCESIQNALESLEKIKNQLLEIAEEAKGQDNLEDELQNLISKRLKKGLVETKPVSKTVQKQTPSNLSKYANVGTRLPAKVTAKAELVETPEILKPVPWESFQKYLARVMKSYGHTKALDVAKHMKMEIQTRAVQERMNGGVPNNATREVWSRYFGISENDLYEAFPKTKGASHAN